MSDNWIVKRNISTTSLQDELNAFEAQGWIIYKIHSDSFNDIHDVITFWTIICCKVRP